jgi:hypothetical protein
VAGELLFRPRLLRFPWYDSPMPALAWLLLVRDGAGFPNRYSEFQSQFGLILQGLCHLNSRDSHNFAVIVHQKPTKQIQKTVLSF